MTPTTRTAARTGVLAALVLAVGLLATPPVAAQSSAAPAPPGIVTLVPAAASTASATSRPANGTILYSKIRGGPGMLTIKNGPSQDGVVTLMLGRSKAFSVYVRARSNATVRNIKDGTYTVYFTTGSAFSFSVSKGRFTRGAAYRRFDNRLRFVSSPQYYTIWTITLYPVKRGNAPTTPISPWNYPA